jgi:hypothetical protein
MSNTLARVQALARRGEVRISEHGYDQLAADGFVIADALSGLDHAVVVEDYADFAKGPCVLVLQQDRGGKPIHVVWGIPKDREGPAVMITAYRPDPARWSSDFLERKRS